MQRGFAVLCASAVLLGGTGAAVAHDTSTPAALVITGASGPDPMEVTVGGYLDTSPACRANRRVQVFARYGKWTHRHVWAPGEWELVETVRSGADGAFAGTMARPTLWSVKFVVPRTDAGRRGHRHVCGAASRGLGFQ